MNKRLLLAGAFLAVIVIGIFIYDYFIYSDIAHFLTKARPASGVVEDVIHQTFLTDGEWCNFHPQVRFRDSLGREFVFLNDAGDCVGAFKVGQSVEVLYESGNPQHAHINSFDSLWSEVMQYSVMGGCFVLIGFALFGPLLFSWRKKKWLRRHGQPVATEFLKVFVDPSSKRFGKSPYRILSQWVNPRTDAKHFFHSEAIWYDPTQYVMQKEISVLIDPKKPKKYYMDISFLPKKNK